MTSDVKIICQETQQHYDQQKFTDEGVAIVEQIQNQKKFLLEIDSIFSEKVYPPGESIFKEDQRLKIVDSLQKSLKNYKDVKSKQKQIQFDVQIKIIEQLKDEQQFIETISNLFQDDTRQLQLIYDNQYIVNFVQQRYKEYKVYLQNERLQAIFNNYNIDKQILEFQNLQKQSIELQTKIQEKQAPKSDLNLIIRQNDLDKLNTQGYNWNELLTQLNEEPFQQTNSSSYNTTQQQQFNSNEIDSELIIMQQIQELLDQKEMIYFQSQKIFSEILRQLQIQNYDEQKFNSIITSLLNIFEGIKKNQV